MTPADHYHSHFRPPSKDCNTLFNLNNPCQNQTLNARRSHFPCHNKHSSSGAGSAFSGNLYSSGINNNNTDTNAGSADAHATMGGQTPIFFAPSSSLVVASHHKPGQELHEAIISANKQLNSRPEPPQLVDFKEVIRRSSEGASGSASEQVRMAKRPHLGFTSGDQNYNPGPGSGRSAGDEMSVDYGDQMDGGEYMDPLEGAGELMRKGSRRLGYDQVKALEKAFAVENRLEPERKVRLASQLGLQPRQVAVWFQNRRARWKTKQMERDYSLLKNKFEALKADRDKLFQEKGHLQAELARLIKGQPLARDGMPGKKKQSEGEQDSPTLASCLLVDDAAANQHAKSGRKAGQSTRRNDDQLDEEVEEDEEIEEDGASPSKRIRLKPNLLQNESLSSTEDSDINNDGAIVSLGSTSFQEDGDYYSQQWRLPTQLLHKPLSIKNEEWPEQGENMSSFNVHLDANWYNWGC